MMKKKVLFASVCLLVLSFLILGCKDKYAEANKLNNEYTELVQTYINDLEKAASAADVAKAINRLADGQQDLWPRMKKLSEKYPELQNKSNLPAEIEESQKEAEEMGKKMMATMMKIMPYMGEPEVQKAQKRLQEVMAK